MESLTHLSATTTSSNSLALHPRRRRVLRLALPLGPHLRAGASDCTVRLVAARVYILEFSFIYLWQGLDAAGLARGHCG